MRIIRLPDAALARPETFRERLALMCRRRWRRHRNALGTWPWWILRKGSSAIDGAPIRSQRKVSPVIRCKASGRTYRPSHPHGCDDVAALAAAISGKACFYFREIERVKRPWWKGGSFWRDTGKIWEPESGEFDLERAVDD